MPISSLARVLTASLLNPSTILVATRVVCMASGDCSRSPVMREKNPASRIRSPLLFESSAAALLHETIHRSKNCIIVFSITYSFHHACENLFLLTNSQNCISYESPSKSKSKSKGEMSSSSFDFVFFRSRFAVPIASLYKNGSEISIKTFSSSWFMELPPMRDIRFFWDARARLLTDSDSNSTIRAITFEAALTTSSFSSSMNVLTRRVKARKLALLSSLSLSSSPS